MEATLLTNLVAAIVFAALGMSLIIAAAIH